jgi:hypothetical protein
LGWLRSLPDFGAQGYCLVEEQASLYLDERIHDLNNREINHLIEGLFWHRKLYLSTERYGFVMPNHVRVTQNPGWIVLIVSLTLVLIACAPTSADKPSKMVGTWQGKDPYDQSNLNIQITFNAGRYTLSASDDKTTPDWCGVTATASASGTLNPNQELPVNMLWVCDNASKTSQTFPTTITYNSSNDTITAYSAPFTRIK